MDVLRAGLFRIWPFKHIFSCSVEQQQHKKNDSKKLTRVLGPWESYVVNVQSILIWENPIISSLAVVAVNVLFWLLVYIELRVYFVVSTALLVIFLHQQWVHSIWPEIRIPPPEPEDTEEWTPVHPSVLSVPEISCYMETTWQGLVHHYLWLLHLRHHQPALFCALVCTVFGGCAVVGHLVPGAMLLYCIIMGLLTGPALLIHVVPQAVYDRLAHLRASLTPNHPPLNMDISTCSIESDLADFLPELGSIEAQAALDVPLMSQDPPELEQMQEQSDERDEDGDEETISSNKACRLGIKKSQEFLPVAKDKNTITSYYSSELPTPDEFPSYDHESADELDLPDIELPVISKQSKSSRSQENPPSEEIKFVSSHFGDSSDEDDDFTAGLTFSERSRLGPQRQIETTFAAESSSGMEGLSQLVNSMMAQNASSMLSTIGQNIVTSVIEKMHPDLVSQYAEQQENRLIAQQMQDRQSQPSTHMSSSQPLSMTDLEEDFELISDEEFQ